MAEAESAHQAASATHEDTSQQRAGRRRRTSADPQRAQQGATAAAADAPAALQALSRLQQLADASPQVAQLRRLQALADGRFAPVAQLAGGPEEEVELLQGKFASAELPPQLHQAPRANNTGLPDQLKSGIESLSGLSMDHVRVHYSSSQPAQLNALAYAQGSDIHLALGQERNLPHEAWHVVQQVQGRVKPTRQMKEGLAVNDSPALEREADQMGLCALHAAPKTTPPQAAKLSGQQVLQGYFIYGPNKIDSASKAIAKFDRSQLGNSKVRGHEKERLLSERWQALQDMADSPDCEGKANSYQTLKELIASFSHARKLLASGMSELGSGSSAKVSVSGMLASNSIESLPESLQSVVAPLLYSGRVFPRENILKTAKSATGHMGFGFVNELNLALSLMNGMPDAMIQIGVVHPLDLPRYLGFTPTPSQIKTNGFVGGDIAVWQRPEPERDAPKSNFIQAKTATNKTLRENVIAASNQLASLTASGDPVSKSAEREYTYTGDSYEGAIYVEMVDDIDMRALVKIATEGINHNRAYVSKVVIRLLGASGASFFLLDAAHPDGLLSSSNPLIQAPVRAPFPDEYVPIRIDLLHLVRHLNTVSLSWNRPSGQQLPEPAEVVPLLAIALQYGRSLYQRLADIDYSGLSLMKTALGTLEDWLQSSRSTLSFSKTELDALLGRFRRFLDTMH
jgi:hypothetical protein